MCMYVYVCVCISVYMCMYVHVSNVYLHVACRTCVKCACPSHCMYVYVCVCICIYLYVLVCICMYHILMCMYCMYWHTCAYMCIHVYICKPHTGHIYSFMCWCPQQALNIPRGGGQPAGPTQDSHGQQPRHFIPRSGTHSHTRFGAPVGAARVGGAKAAPLHCPWAIQAQWALGDSVLSPARADLGRWCCA